MHESAYAAQCTAAETTHTPTAAARPGKGLTLFALALGTFAIGSGEFGTNGIIELYAKDFNASIPLATWAVTAYAFGVMIGSPLITIGAARVNRRTVLLGLVALFVVGTSLSAAAPSVGFLIIARFITGTVQGAYFGAGAVVASYVYGPGKGGRAFATVMAGLTVATIFGSPLGTFIGQALGWQWLYIVVAVVGLLAGVALLAWLPRTADLDGGSVRGELSALGRPLVWVVVVVAALGISSIFAVYTFIAPIVTGPTGSPASVVPVALAVFGIGMAVGNAIGGRLADRYQSRGLVLGLVLVCVFLVVVAVGGTQLPVLLVGLFGVGASAMMAIPSIQVLLSRFAPDAPTLVGSLNLAALNLANALGAVGGAIALSAGLGVLSAPWVGLLMVIVGLALFGAVIPRALGAGRPAAPGGAPAPVPGD
ncbi:MFS transporter [Curtobacterium sp. 458]|uniref:MFS transporter n=1 Tax=Curtobacterium sp. 458 TaxID=3050069 RepID=UPI0025B58D50|nr:MFS transporter [Curtobacterium sp. 458]WJY00861.1 MFS transporter [Curtobacterium sp. 458]